MHKIKLDIAQLISDLGGAAYVAKITGKSRTAPYSWINRSYISSEVLECIKTAHPEVDIDKYFIKREGEQRHDSTAGETTHTI